MLITRNLLTAEQKVKTLWKLNLNTLIKSNFVIRLYMIGDNNEERKNWYANEKTPDFEDFNRIERICLDYYNGLQRYRPRRLSITLGMATTDLKI